MSNDFRLLMISAMYENGGNTTHRLFDGHPQMFVYPFESQVGTNLVRDHLSAMFPVKYRWPVFDLDSTSENDYKAIIDEECKVRARTPEVSKFRHFPFDFSDEARAVFFRQYIEKTGRSRACNIAAFFKATFEAWKDYKISGRQEVYVGYSPIITVDACKVLSDFPSARILHVVRNPWSAYADTKKRPVPLSIENYMLCWTLTQYHALLYKRKFPDNMHVLRFEDIISDPLGTLAPVCRALGTEEHKTLKTPTWNSVPLKEIYPWGTIRKAAAETNRAAAEELDADEREEIRLRTWQYLEIFDYNNFLK